MNAQQLAPLPGYPQNWGTKQVEVAELAGPTLYAAGGQTVNASQLGWGCFDEVAPVGLSYSGTYFCRVFLQPTSAAPSKQNQSVTSVKIAWYVLATGVEAGAIDLSGEIVRLFLVSN